MVLLIKRKGNESIIQSTDDLSKESAMRKQWLETFLDVETVGVVYQALYRQFNAVDCFLSFSLTAQPSGGNSLNNDMADDGPGAATVAGVVVVLVAVIAVIVVVVVIWRRRRPKR